MKKIILSMMFFGLSTGLISVGEIYAGEKVSKIKGSFKNLSSRMKRQSSSLSSSMGENIDKTKHMTSAFIDKTKNKAAAIKTKLKEKIEKRKLAKENETTPFELIFKSKANVTLLAKTIDSIEKNLNTAKSLMDSVKTSNVIKNIVPLKALTAELSIYLNMCIDFVNIYEEAIDILKTAKSDEGKAYMRALDRFTAAHDSLYFAEDLENIVSHTVRMINKFNELEVENAEEISKKLVKLAKTIEKISIATDFVQTFAAINNEVIDDTFAEQHEETLKFVRKVGPFLEKMSTTLKICANSLVVEDMVNSDDTTTLFDQEEFLDAME